MLLRQPCGGVRRRDMAAAILALVVVAALFVAAPGSLLDKADRAAYAVCHRIPGRTFAVDGRPLPLCARCSGTYLGAFAGFAVLAWRGRGRASRFPGRGILAVMAGFLLLWGIDGFNSYLTLFPGLPHLYEPHNVLRLATGILEGLAIAAMMLPAINLSLWRDPDPVVSVAGWGDLLWLLAGGAVVAVAVASDWAPLLYPLALLSGLLVVGLVGVVNAMGLLLVLRRDGKATSWREVLVPCLAGLALAATELAMIGAARALLTERYGLPF